MKKLIQKILKEETEGFLDSSVEDWEWTNTSWSDDIKNIFSKGTNLVGGKFSIINKDTGELTSLADKSINIPKNQLIFTFTKHIQVPQGFHGIQVQWEGPKGPLEIIMGVDYFETLFMGLKRDYAFFVGVNGEPIMGLIHPLWKNKLKAYYRV